MTVATALLRMAEEASFDCVEPQQNSYIMTHAHGRSTTRTLDCIVAPESIDCAARHPQAEVCRILLEHCPSLANVATASDRAPPHWTPLMCLADFGRKSDDALLETAEALALRTISTAALVMLCCSWWSNTQTVRVQLSTCCRPATRVVSKSSILNLLS
jgi:hypothetical protein